MRNINKTWLLWMVVFLSLLFIDAAWGQETNGPASASPPSAQTDPVLFPKGKDAAWLAVIPLVTFAITWIFGKIPKLHKDILPFLTPVIGVALGSVIDWATKANFPWWSQAGAGYLAVSLYESVRGLTKAGPESALTPTPKPFSLKQQG